jgi:hypothetical protein
MAGNVLINGVPVAS